jgi:hypothetical protein
MPAVTRWFIKAALAHFVAALPLGIVLAAPAVLPVSPAIGWTLQLAMGVAFWILPRFAQGHERGNEALAWCAFVLLNAGVWLVGVGWMLGAPGWIPWLGRAVEAAAAITFAAHAWPRVKPFAT